MNEIDKLEKSREYLYSLANGINPVTKEELLSDSILNQASTSRFLFYACEIIDRELFRQRKKLHDARQIFVLSSEDLKTVSISEEPITLNNFYKTIRTVFPNDNLPSDRITKWLLKNDFLIFKNGRKVATEKGNEIGITSIEKTQNNYSFFVNYYDSNAQTFILDHLNEMISSID